MIWNRRRNASILMHKNDMKKHKKMIFIIWSAIASMFMILIHVGTRGDRFD